MIRLVNITALSVVVACTCQAEETAKPPGIGDKAPTWKNLDGTDGQKHSLADLAAMDVVVVCFTCNSCPYSTDYEQRMIDFQKKYSADKQNVQLVAINANAVAADSLEKMKDRAKKQSFNFPYLRDETQAVARAFDAIYTPEFFVLNKDRKIIFRGAMDDSTKAENVKINYVDLAVQATLAGETPKTTTVGARGCAIRFKRKRR